MKRFSAMGFLVLLMVLIGLLKPTAAHAEDPYEPWQFSYERICFEDNRWTRWPTAEATRQWNASDVWVVNWDDCSSQPRNRVIKLKVYNDPTDYACAKTGSDHYTWQYVYTEEGVRKAAWHPDEMTIWMNMAANIFDKCHKTSAQRLHLIVHELGHALGMSHRSGASVMASWSYSSVTSSDLYNANVQY